MNTQKCWALTQGEFSDYRVLAVFSDEETARSQMSRWGADHVEELPFNCTIPQPPANMFAHCAVRNKKTMDIVISKYRPCDWEVVTRGDEVYVFSGLVETYETYMYARDEDHAMKIAAERFALYDAKEAGIAC